MKSILIGIAGGSGAGKSTLCTALQEKYSKQVGLIQLDDYFKKSHLLPEYNGHKNWDHPDALRLDQLYKDLLHIRNGESVWIDTINETVNPNYKQTNERISVEFHPRPIMLIEGYLILHDANIRELFATSVWLDIDQEESWERRIHFKNDTYLKDVLVPMNRKFVQPSKQHAGHVIDVAKRSKEAVCKEVETILHLG